jgi:predicted aspartyl protease
LLSPAGAFPEDALLDTGADDTVFPESLATKLGLDLSNAPVGEASGVGSGPVQIRYARVTLRLATASERREWQGWVGFTSVRLKRSLLGFAGFLQYFTATFYGDREEVELTVNGLYPGT